jgi:hypothetical protein
MTKLLPVLFAEVAIMVLGAIALMQRMDGAIFAGCIGALAGLGGYAIRKNGGPS